jgi:hypothetical protein
MTGVRYVFRTSGEYAGHIIGDYLFTPTNEWLGFVVGGNEVYNTNGTFLGYLLDDDRIVRRRGEIKPRRPRPARPTRPVRPLRPLRRLRMPRLPYPYEDSLQTQAVQRRAGSGEVRPSLQHLEGAKIIAGDGTSLGTISRDRYATDSIANPYGPYGSPYSPTSIFNQYGQYGGPYASYSPFNQYSNTPPRIVRSDQIVATLTVNQYVAGPRVDPEELSAWVNAA